MRRRGKKTGPGRLRRIASNSPSTRMSSSAIRNSLTLTRNFDATLGSESQKIGPLRNACWKRGQPGALTTMYAVSPKKTTVEVAAIRSDRAPSAPGPKRGPRVTRGGGTDPVDAGRAPSGSIGGGDQRVRAG